MTKKSKFPVFILPYDSEGRNSMVNENILHIGKNRELFWDDYLVDSSCSTAFPRLMQPVKKETCFRFDQGMELEQVSYPCIVKDESGYKMYYLPWEMYKDGSVNSYLAVIESQDGIHWTRPDLNIFDHPELMKAPVVRNGKEATVGYCPEVWDNWK